MAFLMGRCDEVGQFLRLPIWPKIHSIPANTSQRLPSTTNNGNKMLLILSSFACFSKKKYIYILKIKHPNVVSDKLALGNGVVLSPADGDAGVEGGEEGPV